MLGLDKNGIFCNETNLTTPYSIKECLGWVKRFFLGPNKINNYNIKSIPKSHILNDITPKYTISFIGDIMDVNFKDILIHESVNKFIRGSDFLIGNFEGTITSEKRAYMDKRHKPQIMDTLELLFPPNKTYLSVANNHSGDFGYKHFFHSVKRMKKRGFKIFGTIKAPYVDIKEDLRITAGTQWSNRPCNYVAKLEKITHFLKKFSCNLLFPHWGFEMELYPRFETIEKGNLFLSNFDILIGHHSHCPQPVSKRAFGKTNKLIAYSLGDFCFGINNKMFENYNYGIIIKVEIGINKERRWLIGKVNWSFLKSIAYSNKESIVVTVDNF